MSVDYKIENVSTKLTSSKRERTGLTEFSSNVSGWNFSTNLYTETELDGVVVQRQLDIQGNSASIQTQPNTGYVMSSSPENPWLYPEGNPIYGVLRVEDAAFNLHIGNAILSSGGLQISLPNTWPANTPIQNFAFSIIY